MKIAIVHEMLIKLWGAEKVVENWTALYPQADIFTLIYDEKKVGDVFPKTKIQPQTHTLTTQKVYKLFWKQRLCLPFMAQSIEQLDLSTYDVVLVSSSGFAHGIITKPETRTIIYYHSPGRYMWDWTNEYKKDIGAQKGIKGYLLNSLLLKLRQWDYMASQRNNIIMANSRNTAERIKKYYRLEAPVIYPPVETKRFAKKVTADYTSPYKKYYIIISALSEFKRLDIAITWFASLSDVNLVIVGDGNLRKTLEKQTNGAANISFVGKKYGDELVSLVQNSLWLIFPWEEDFWIVPIEVMAAGKSVFALHKWGLTESVIAGKTGDFFYKSNGQDFLECFKLFHKNVLKWKYSSSACKKQAQKFDTCVFEKYITNMIQK